jgi:hypothetical protein
MSTHFRRHAENKIGEHGEQESALDERSKGLTRQVSPLSVVFPAATPERFDESHD